MRTRPGYVFPRLAEEGSLSTCMFLLPCGTLRVRPSYSRTRVIWQPGGEEAYSDVTYRMGVVLLLQLLRKKKQVFYSKSVNYIMRTNFFSHQDAHRMWLAPKFQGTEGSLPGHTLRHSHTQAPFETQNRWRGRQSKTFRDFTRLLPCRRRSLFHLASKSATLQPVALKLVAPAMTYEADTWGAREAQC